MSVVQILLCCREDRSLVAAGVMGRATGVGFSPQKDPIPLRGSYSTTSHVDGGKLFLSPWKLDPWSDEVSFSVRRRIIEE